MHHGPCPHPPLPFQLAPSIPCRPLPQALFQGLNPAAVAYLHIHVRRTHVVEDALNQVGAVGGGLEHMLLCNSVCTVCTAAARCH